MFSNNKNTETLWSKENHTESSKKENAKEKAESIKIYHSVKTNFFEALTWLKQENFETTKVSYTPEDHTHKISDQFDYFSNYSAQNGGQ